MLAVLKSDVNFKRRCDGIPPVPAPGTPRATRKGKWVIKAYQCWPRNSHPTYIMLVILAISHVIWRSHFFVTNLCSRRFFIFLKRSVRAFLQIDIRSHCDIRRCVVYCCSFMANKFQSKIYEKRNARGD